MKKIKKLFFSLILFLFYANIADATTKGTYVVSENNTGKDLLVFIGIVLVVLVIFLGYTLDKKDEIKKRRKKYNNNSDDEDEHTQSYEDEIQYLEDIETDEKKTSATDDTIMINYAKLKKIEKETVEYNEEDDEEYYEKENVNLENSFNKDAMDSTMILDFADEIKEEFIKDEEPEELDIDEDLELLELERTIKAANIRRYTRKKKKEVKKVKRYTRKKEKKEPEVEPKRRGRPAKVKAEEVVEVPKRGRGRPRKIQTTEVIKKETRKRGRPAKVKTEEATKMPKRGRGRPRKN